MADPWLKPSIRGRRENAIAFCHSTKGFSGNVRETSYQRFKVLAFCDWEKALTLSIKMSVLTFLVKKRTMKLCGVSIFRGVARIFQKGGGGGVTEATFYLMWREGMKAHINHRQEPLTTILYNKTNFKKVGFSTMAFTAKILSWRFRHLNIVGCLLKRRPTKGGSRAPQDPPSYTPDF